MDLRKLEVSLLLSNHLHSLLSHETRNTKTHTNKEEKKERKGEGEEEKEREREKRADLEGHLRQQLVADLLVGPDVATNTLQMQAKQGHFRHLADLDLKGHRVLLLWLVLADKAVRSVILKGVAVGLKHTVDFRNKIKGRLF